MKRTQIIPLGSACDIAMNLDILNLRKNSLFFDWLWNLDSGLKFVSDCVEQDFKNVISSSPYAYRYHYRFDKEVCVYKDAESVVHLHSNPIEDLVASETLKKRAKRTKALLESNDFKLFIYYRAYPEDLIKHGSYNLKDTLRSILDEKDLFLRTFEKKYPNQINNYKLLLILQVESMDLANAKILINEVKQENQSLNLHLMLYRNDSDLSLKQEWKEQFKHILMNEKSIPKRYWVEASIKQVKKRCITLSKNALKRILH